ncbi:MAG: DEAD/DEAH box helicase [Pyrinomonadaceae bacterium]|nr:DEAD/DEAH box helicase [Pyrinomonadaceae bacterium]MCX7638920.1 DEAD/DEAH box helicase [Pyrinomonadaceae bacterium]MDW8304943.1 DEAD/DEAH box helicase [Acidobacteriota bacterium]
MHSQKRIRSALTKPSRKDQKKQNGFASFYTKSQKDALERLLEGIGSPEPTAFKPDKFQLEALQAIEHGDVLVTAPTGSGKTWIAREEIRRLLYEGKRAWYTTPLKALTNSKYIEFCEEFGAENVGILTGDRKENVKAPLIVGTTEIYRNQLFDALRQGENVRTDFLILDEAHYLSDDDRGHVWEESIILTPPRIRILLLSATIGNPEEFAAWIEEVRGTKVKIVRATKRPVELRAAFIAPNLALMPLFNNKGKINQDIFAFSDFPSREPLRLPEIPPTKLISALREYNLLPAIVFMPTRRRCDEAALEILHRTTSTDKEKKLLRAEFIEKFEADYPEIREHRHKNLVIQAGVASHHAGHLPAWKLLVEKMMSSGLLDAIFATSTVAAGVDFPARTVVISNADTRSSQGWRPLQVNELQQMTGRAGRRGKDKVGFVVLAPSNFQSPTKIASLLRSEPDPMQSKFKATYSTLLNLLDAYGSFWQVRQIAERSFAFRDTAKKITTLEERLDKKRLTLKTQIQTAGLEKLSVEDVCGFERLMSARNRLFEKPTFNHQEKKLQWLRETIKPGMIVSKKSSAKRLFLVLSVIGDRITAIEEDGGSVNLPLGRIKQVFRKVYPLDIETILKAFDETIRGENPPIEKPDFAQSLKDEIDEALSLLNKLMSKIIKQASKDNEKQVEKFLWEHVKVAESIESLQRTIEQLRNEIWIPFEKKARVLSELGYLDFERETVTETGRWLADLRVDRPLFIGEALRKIDFQHVSVETFAAFIAAIAADRERNYGEIEISDETLEILTTFEEVIFDVAKIEIKYGVPTETDINFSAAAAAEQWVKGVSWKKLVSDTRAEEGDLIRLLSRTGEVLLQIANLKDSNPKASELARFASELILREPVR